MKNHNTSLLIILFNSYDWAVNIDIVPLYVKSQFLLLL